MFIDFLCPVENQGVIVKTNSKTGEPYALFKLFNVSDKVVTAVSFVVHAYDAFGGELGAIKVDLSDLHAGPKSFFAEKKAVSLKDYAEAKHITVDFLSVSFEEGEPYAKSEELFEVLIDEPDYEEKMRLVSLAGNDAFCYAQDKGIYWVCVCGRPNMADDEECVRCGRTQKAVFENFSSRSALNKVAEKVEADKAEEILKQNEEQAEKIKQRNKKLKKIALRGAIGVICLIILGIIAMFSINGVRILLGNSATKKGDFVKAYSYYRQADSKKVGDVFEHVQGNSASNLFASGLIASDEENLYYVDTNYSIYKESKTTGEKTKLGEAAGFFLNVMGDWVYYLDPYTQQIICRVKKDGSETQHLYENAESTLSYMTVVGDEVYFLSQELRDDLTPELQEQIAQSGSTSALYRVSLYRLKIGETKPKRVTDKDLLQYVVYENNIYYLDRTETAVYSMDLNGKKHTKIVSGPVYDFDVVDDALYYQDGTPSQQTGIPRFSIEKAQTDGIYIENVVDGRLATAFNVTDDAVYYIGFESPEATTAPLYKKTADGEEVLIEDCLSFNVRDGYVFAVTGDQKVVKTKFDKSGLEEVVAETEEATE